jgi:hypothetical protein
MGVQSNITHLFQCSNPICLTQYRDHAVRHKDSDWPEPVLPFGWADVGEFGVFCPRCSVIIRSFFRGGIIRGDCSKQRGTKVIIREGS